jgi:hypothetical protein
MIIVCPRCDRRTTFQGYVSNKVLRRHKVKIDRERYCYYKCGLCKGIIRIRRLDEDLQKQPHTGKK